MVLSGFISADGKGKTENISIYWVFDTSVKD